MVDYIDRKILARVREAIARAATGEFIRYEAPLMRPSGEEVIFDFSLHPSGFGWHLACPAANALEATADIHKS